MQRQFSIKRFSILFSFWVLLFLCKEKLSAQTSMPIEIKKSSRVEKIDGQKFYMHTVEAGQTIYSIARAYSVNSKDIIFENPEAVDGLEIGQVIKIPFKAISEIKESDKKNPAVPIATFINHTVEKQQTLYAISKLYSVSIDDIKAINPEIEQGIKEGQVLKIPQKSGVTSAPVTKAIVEEEKETVAENKIQGSKGKTFSIALLLPFNVDDIDTAKFEKNIRTAIPPKSYPAIEFYEGFLLACDTLNGSGMNLKLSVYDAPNDSLKIARLLEKNDLRKSELIVGPFHNLPSTLVADYAKQNRIPNVIPYAQQNKLLLGNPYAIKVSASSGTQVEAVAQFISSHYKKQHVIVLHNALLKEKSSVKLFKQMVNASAGKDSVIEVIFKSAGVKGLQAKLDPVGQNIIFIPSNDQAFVTSLVNSLRILKKDYKISLFGMESWISFENLDINTIQDLQLHIPSGSLINYEDPATIDMMKLYRKKYKTDPSKYALQGYDCAMYFLTALNSMGKDFYKTLPNNKKNGLQCSFKFTETAVESGYENQSVHILLYKDFSLSPANE